MTQLVATTASQAELTLAYNYGALLLNNSYFLENLVYPTVSCRRLLLIRCRQLRTWGLHQRHINTWKTEWLLMRTVWWAAVIFGSA